MGRHLTYANVMSTLAVFLALGLGTAWALSRDSVGSKQIRSGAVRSAEIKNRTIRGKDVRNQAITGRNIDEGTLRLDGLTSMRSGVGSCDPATATYEDCGTIQLFLPKRAKAFIVVQGEYASSAGGTAPFELDCQLEVDGASIQGTFVAPGEATAQHDTSHTDGFGLTATTQTLPSGRHQISLVCRDPDDDAELPRTQISALGIGAQG